MSLPIRELLSIGKTQLENSGDMDAEIDSKILFCHVKNYDENEFRMAWQYEANDDDCDRYFALVDRRCQGEPTQYILGKQNFLGYDFIVNENVLIPRRETEVLVDDAIKLIKSGAIRDEAYSKNKGEWAVLDLCTGSGAIGVTMAKECGRKVKMTLSDISEEALNVAKENAATIGANDVKFVSGDLLAPFKSRFSTKKFDLIISNPPYIETDVIPTLQREIKEHEPLIALDGGKNGMDYYRAIVDNAHIHLKKHGILMFEIGNNQGDAMKNLLEGNGNYTNIQVLQDLAGNDRVVVATKKDKKSRTVAVQDKSDE